MTNTVDPIVPPDSWRTGKSRPEFITAGRNTLAGDSKFKLHFAKRPVRRVHGGEPHCAAAISDVSVNGNVRENLLRACEICVHLLAILLG